MTIASERSAGAVFSAPMRTMTSRSSSAERSISSSVTRPSSICMSSLICDRSWKRCSDSRRAAPSTYSESSAVAASSVNAGASRSRNVRSVCPSDGSASLVCSLRAPRPRPTSSSLRYSDAHATRPLSTGASNVSTRLETPPVDVMITTMTICGCSGRTSMWRIVAVSSGGAETIASRFVTCDSVSVVTRIASSTSRRVSASSIVWPVGRLDGSRRSTK